MLCAFVYTLLTAVVVNLWIRATWTDPSDPAIKLQRLAKSRNEPFNAAQYSYYCDVCNCFVNGSAKHCGKCNRCVSYFDHHCKWINNCVGNKNYAIFFRLIIATVLMSSVHLLTSSIVVYRLYTGIAVRPAYKSAIWIMWVAIGLNLVTVLFLGHLICYHVYLQWRGLTTFEHIKLKEKNYQSKVVKKITSIESGQALSSLDGSLPPTPRGDKSGAEKHGTFLAKFFERIKAKPYKPTLELQSQVSTSAGNGKVIEIRPKFQNRTQENLLR